MKIFILEMEQSGAAADSVSGDGEMVLKMSVRGFDVAAELSFDFLQKPKPPTRPLPL
jgi:hypothetical protein